MSPYIRPNIASRAALRVALARGDTVTVWHPTHRGSYDGVLYVEGPHYPRPHRWHARVLVREGRVVHIVR